MDLEIIRRHGRFLAASEDERGEMRDDLRGFGEVGIGGSGLTLLRGRGISSCLLDG